MNVIRLTIFRYKPKTELKVNKSLQGEGEIVYHNHAFNVLIYGRQRNDLSVTQTICIFRAINILYTYIIVMCYINIDGTSDKH